MVTGTLNWFTGEVHLFTGTFPEFTGRFPPFINRFPSFTGISGLNARPPPGWIIVPLLRELDHFFSNKKKTSHYDSPLACCLLFQVFPILIRGNPDFLFKSRTKIMLCIISDLFRNLQNRQVRRNQQQTGLLDPQLRDIADKRDP